MIQFFIFSFSLIMNLIFIQLNHPLGVGLILLIQTLLVCLLTGFFAKTFWFSYILFLVFLGGMLVLFIYVVSLASNEMFSFSTNLLLISLFLYFFIMAYMFYKDMMVTSFSLNFEMKESSGNFTPENSFSLNKLYNFPSNYMNIMLMIYLLITLVAVVKITQFNQGPLRKTT